MQQFINFIIHHWELWTAFFVILLAFIAFEARNKLTGIPQISPQQTTMLINREDALLVDLRDSISFTKGHVINAINVPLSDFTTKLGLLDKYKQKTIIVAGTPGQPFHKIYSQLQTNGFSKIYSLKGGIPAWQNAGLPLTKSVKK